MKEKTKRVLQVIMLIVSVILFVLSVISTLMTYRTCPPDAYCGYQGGRTLFMIIDIISLIGIIYFSYKLTKK